MRERRSKSRKSRAISKAMHPSNFRRNDSEWVRVGSFTWVQLQERFRDDRGSLSLLTGAMMSLLLITSFLVIDSASALMAQRELIQIAEPAISKAAGNLDRNTYYFSGAENTIPIDCVSAYEVFLQEINSSQLRGSDVSISRWNCETSRITAEIQSKARHIISAKSLGITPEYSVSAIVSSTSKVHLN